MAKNGKQKNICVKPKPNSSLKIIFNLFKNVFTKAKIPNNGYNAHKIPITFILIQKKKDWQKNDLKILNLIIE